MRRWKLWRNLLILLVVIFPLLVATTIYKDRNYRERIEQTEGNAVHSERDQTDKTLLATL